MSIIIIAIVSFLAGCGVYIPSAAPSQTNQTRKNRRPAATSGANIEAWGGIPWNARDSTTIRDVDI